MLVAAMIIAPAILLAAGARTNKRSLMIAGLVWYLAIAVFLVLALPIGGSIESGRIR